MAAVDRDNSVFKVTEVDIPEDVDLPHTLEKVACIEMPHSGNNEKKYISEPFAQTLKTITTNLVTTDITVQLNEHYGHDGDAYYIYKKHPNLNMFDDLWAAGKSKVLNGGSRRRRRRPSRKYKKSKRVLRRKSRSTRRR